jgi:hypothetical protein
MRNVFVNAAVAAVVSVTALVIAASSGLALFAPRASGKKMVHATITLDRVGVNCQIVTAPQTLEAFRRETVEWTIVDRCGVLVEASAEVAIAFTGNDPLDPQCVKRGKKRIRCSLNNPDYGYYKYSVTAPGAVTEDPELEIVQ